MKVRVAAIVSCPGATATSGTTRSADVSSR